jgi:hypothetical protein
MGTGIELRKGKTKTLVQSSIDSALLAVEIYNKPRTTFRSEGYITLMVIAWLKLLHAYFNHTIGDKYYYKNKNKYEIVDGEKKTWELSTCINKCSELSGSVKENLFFFIKLRNKIEHRYIEKGEIDTLIFGECQALLYNYETFLVSIFGDRYALNESLVYSLQFSHMRIKGQLRSNRRALSKDLKEIVDYVAKYRNSLDETIYNSQEFSIRLLQVPKISNTSRVDFAVDFVKLDELKQEDKNLYSQITALVKDRKVKVEGVNVGKLKPSKIIERVNDCLGKKLLTHSSHRYIYTVFQIRPSGDVDDPFYTNTRYCHYDETHNDYIYNEEWADFLIYLLQAGPSIEEIKEKFKQGEFLEIKKYEPSA